MGELILSRNIIINNSKEIYLLFRKKHNHYETPGGKVENDEDLKETARRELIEEVKGIEIVSMEYFGKALFTIPDVRKALAYKFITKIKGKPVPNEKIFDVKKSKWLPFQELEKENISPDLKLFLPKLNDFFNKY